MPSRGLRPNERPIPTRPPSPSSPPTPPLALAPSTSKSMAGAPDPVGTEKMDHFFPSKETIIVSLKGSAQFVVSTDRRVFLLAERVQVFSKFKIPRALFCRDLLNCHPKTCTLFHIQKYTLRTRKHLHSQSISLYTWALAPSHKNSTNANSLLRRR